MCEDVRPAGRGRVWCRCGARSACRHTLRFCISGIAVELPRDARKLALRKMRRQLLGMPGRHDAAARALGTLFGKNHRRRARALGTRLLDKPVGKRAHGVGGAYDQHIAKVPLAQAQVGGEARKEREDKFRREGEGEQVGEFKEGVEAKGEGIGRDPGKAARTRRFGQEREAVAAQEGGPRGTERAQGSGRGGSGEVGEGTRRGIDLEEHALAKAQEGDGRKRRHGNARSAALVEPIVQDKDNHAHHGERCQHAERGFGHVPDAHDASLRRGARRRWQTFPLPTGPNRHTPILVVGLPSGKARNACPGARRLLWRTWESLLERCGAL